MKYHYVATIEFDNGMSMFSEMPDEIVENIDTLPHHTILELVEKRFLYKRDGTSIFAKPRPRVRSIEIKTSFYN